MKLVDKWMRLRPLYKGLSIACAVILIAAITVLIVFLSSGYYATTMRLLKIEGTVTLEDENGVEKSIVKNMRFSSGQALNTGASSLASIALDDDKIVTLQENSRAEFTKSRNMMELKLTAGGLFFEVNKTLETDETFDIRTSTMVVGIRGTSGYIFVDEEGRQCIIVTAGKVHITGINPITHEIKETEATAGQKLTVYLYNDRVIDSVEFFLESLTEDQIPAFPIQMLKDDPDLLARVCGDTGWDPDVLLGIAGGTVTIPSDSSESSESSESTTTSETSESSQESETSSSSSESSSSSDRSSAPQPTNTPKPTNTPRPTNRSSAPAQSSSTNTSRSSSNAQSSSAEDRSEEPSGGSDQPSGEQPSGEQPSGDQPSGDQPSGGSDQPSGDAPSGDYSEDNSGYSDNSGDDGVAPHG